MDHPDGTIYIPLAKIDVNTDTITKTDADTNTIVNTDANIDTKTMTNANTNESNAIIHVSLTKINPSTSNRDPKETYNNGR